MNPVRLGLLRLVDSAPAVVAADHGLFERQGVAVQLCIEPSWSSLVDRFAQGTLDAAIMLPPLVLAAAAIADAPLARLIVPMGISLGGNTIVLGRTAADAVLPAAANGPQARLFADWVRSEPRPPRFAVVHALSSHNLLFRLWLSGVGINPDRDIEITVIPPDQMVDALSSDWIAGFCAGAPWGAVAEMKGTGHVLLGTSAIWADHPEKCLAVSAAWSEADPVACRGLLLALLDAGRYCDLPENSPTLAALLAGDAGLWLSEAACLAALPGGSGPERICFHKDAAWYPRVDHARWFLRAMQRWGYIDGGIDVHRVASEVYRPDLLVMAADGQLPSVA